MEEVQLELGIRVTTEFPSRLHFDEIHSSPNRRGNRTKEIISSRNQIELSSLCSLVSSSLVLPLNRQTFKQRTISLIFLNLVRYCQIIVRNNIPFVLINDLVHDVVTRESNTSVSMLLYATLFLFTQERETDRALLFLGSTRYSKRWGGLFRIDQERRNVGAWIGWGSVRKVRYRLLCF